MNRVCQLMALCFLVALAGCKSPKQVPYVVDAETIPSEVLSQIPPVADPVIAPGDLLNIEVSSPNMEAVAAFNRGKYIDPQGKINSMQNTNTVIGGSGAESSTMYYLVDSRGDIEFPIIGTLHVGGLDKQQAIKVIREAIYPKYVTEPPTIDIRLMNFRVTVLGAVRSPGQIQSKNERLNFLEAIALAGDLDIQGQRTDILLYRLNPDGTREIHRVNIHDKNFLLSPYYYLQQNDIIYVVPNDSARQRSWQISPIFGVIGTVVGTISSVAALIVGVINLSK